MTEVTGTRSFDLTTNPVAAARHYRFIWFSAMFVGYLAVGIWLSYSRGLIVGDTMSRVADARFVLFSRTPHLAAMGFVFTPLTTFVELPFVAVMNVWPTLLTHAVPALVVSAASMSIAVLQVAGMLRDRRLGVGWIVAVCTPLALHPMIILYGANGMSEALFLLMMAIATRFLLRWMASDDVHDLAILGLAVAMGFLVRYDALAVGIGCAVLVAGTTWYRTGRTGAASLFGAAMDAAIVTAPVGTAFALWTAVSWLTTGQALAQFSSAYGNSAILELSGGASGDAAYRAAFTLIEWLTLEPAVILIVVLSSVVTAVRRVPDALPILVVYGAVLGFQGLVYVRGGTFGFLRFSITVIPMAVSLVGILRPRRGTLYSRRAGPGAHLAGSHRNLSRTRRLWSWVALATLLPGMIISPVLMTRPGLAVQEYAAVAAVLPFRLPPDTELGAETQQRTFATERDVAAYLDWLNLPEGSVITDTLYGDAVLAASDRPRQFVIPSDGDFVNALNDPASYGIRYLLTVPNRGRGTTDALNVRYPTLYANGAGIAVLEMDFPNSGADQPGYRLYRVLRR